MDEHQLRLDGNAAAGLLQELFVPEMTTAQACCASCGKVAELGAQHLYMYPHSPGAAVRCRYCENLMMVVAHARGRFRLGLQGCVWVETDNSASPA